MYTIEKGVLPGSTIAFHTPSPLAKSLFFYPVSSGHFICDNHYQVSRNHHNSYLILYVLEGSGTVVYDSITYTLQAGDILLLDCYKKHSYSTDSWDIMWLHFEGKLSTDYYNTLFKRFGESIKATGSPSAKDLLIHIVDLLYHSNTLNEAMVSCKINQLLCELFMLSSDYICVDSLSPVNQAIHYMKTHLKQPISLDELAQIAHLSPYHFTRVFKKETGCTPYEYLMILRINESKYLLKSTSMLIKEIAYEVGFNNESNFMTYFKRITGYTPTAFRNLPA